MRILVGADPEVFVSHNGKIISGYGLIPGTKTAPFAVNGGAVQVDGMALEFNIDPAETEEEFLHSIGSVLNQMREMIPEHQLILEAVANFDEAYMKTLPEEALLLGCDPDFNAWEQCQNNPPNAASTMRTAAGHIHVGSSETHNIYTSSVC